MQLAQQSCARAGSLAIVQQHRAPRIAQLRQCAALAAKADATDSASAPSASPAANGTPAVAKPAPTTPTSMVDFDELADIIRLVENTDIVELELKSKKFNLTVRKREALKAAEPVHLPQQAYNGPQFYSPPPQAPLPAAPAAQAAPAPVPASVPAAKPAPAAPGGVEIASPMSGTFYRLPAPGEPPFVKEGDIVKKGQTVGIIEAMKLMNEIEAEISGEVIKFCVENAKSVSPGQTLLIIRPT